MIPRPLALSNRTALCRLSLLPPRLVVLLPCRRPALPPRLVLLRIALPLLP